MPKRRNGGSSNPMQSVVRQMGRKKKHRRVTNGPGLNRLPTHTDDANQSPSSTDSDDEDYVDGDVSGTTEQKPTTSSRAGTSRRVKNTSQPAVSVNGSVKRRRLNSTDETAATPSPDATKKSKRNRNTLDGQENGGGAGVGVAENRVCGSLLLPEEVWLAIFSVLVNKVGSLPALYYLLLVCTRFRKVALTPSLWRCLDFDVFEGCVRTKSRSRTLTHFAHFITDYTTELGLRNSSQMSTEQLQAMLLKCPNLRVLDLSFCRRLNPTKTFAAIGENCKSLESLVLQSMKLHQDAYSQSLNGQLCKYLRSPASANLKSVEIVRNYIRNAKTLLNVAKWSCAPGLKELTYSGTSSFLHGAEFSNFIQFIRCTPKMELLRIEELVEHGFKIPTVADVSWPNLKSLSIGVSANGETRVEPLYNWLPSFLALSPSLRELNLSHVADRSMGTGALRLLLRCLSACPLLHTVSLRFGSDKGDR